MTRAPSSRTRWFTITVAALFVIYAVLPFLAGWVRIGDLWGPKIYPLGFHGTLYKLGWHLADNHEIDGTPRIGFWYREEDRPWFYGMYSANHDAYVRRERLLEHWRQAGKSEDEIRLLLGD